ncbi:MAG: DUF6538 domain-containing protein [Methylocella sp.]
MAKSFLQLRGSIYWFRRAVPVELREIIGKREVMFSLKTSDLRAAKRVAALEAVRADDLFENARRKLTAKAQANLPDPDMMAWICNNDLDAPLPENDFSRMLRAIREARGAANKALVASLSPARPKAVVTLAELLKRFRQDRKTGLSVKTLGRHAAQDRLFQEILGASTSIERITREDARRLQRTLKTLPANWGQTTKKFAKKPLSPATANQYLAAFVAAMEFAENEHLIAKSPARGLRIEGDNVRAIDRRSPFATADLSKLFHSPAYVSATGWRHWLPLLGLFTGARLNELCQLSSDDFETIDGVKVFHIRKKVKTQAGLRTVPIHPMLKHLGLLSYVESLSHRAQLFPDLKAKAGYLSEGPSQWFSKLLDSLGIEGGFHCFRHTVNDQLRNRLVPRDQIDQLLGWSGKGMAETVYGSGLEAKVLAKAIAKIKYDGLSLNHLRP